MKEKITSEFQTLMQMYNDHNYMQHNKEYSLYAVYTNGHTLNRIVVSVLNNYYAVIH